MHHFHIVIQTSTIFSVLIIKVTKWWNSHVDTLNNNKYKFLAKLQHVYGETETNWSMLQSSLFAVSIIVLVIVTTNICTKKFFCLYLIPTTEIIINTIVRLQCYCFIDSLPNINNDLCGHVVFLYNPDSHRSMSILDDLLRIEKSICKTNGIWWAAQETSKPPKTRPGHRLDMAKWCQ